VSFELKEGQGSLHPNEAKTAEGKQPDFTGKVCIGGVVYRLAGWRYVTGRGKHWMSLKAELPRQRDGTAPPAPREPSPQPLPEFDDDIPF
jgi:hypothetical protein